MESITLGDNEIDSLINGKPIKKTLSDGKTVLIRQSYMKDIAAPIINHDKEIYSEKEIENIKIAASTLSNTMKLGI